MELRWNPSVHAVRRIKERCGIDETQAKSFINQLMQTAKYVTTQGKNPVYKHEGREVFIVADAEKNTIVTVYSAEETETGAPENAKQPKSSAISITVDRIANAIKREFKRMQTEVTREVRKLSEQVAVMHVEVAQLNVNKIRCKNPITQLHIQARIDEILSQADELARAIDEKLTQFEKAKSEVGAVVGE